jgi:hypothetical protein
VTRLPALCAAVLLWSAAPQPASHSILFIGNSLTTANGLPAMVERLGELNGLHISTRAVAGANLSLEDHWDRGDALREIRRTGWSVVVLQQGPSALPESRVSLRRFTRRFADEVRKSGGKPALYMVWPSRARSGDFPRVSESYRLAASDVRGLLLPAGDAWREAWTRDGALPLYGPDEFHPSALGSYLAALVIVQSVTGQRVSTHLRLDGKAIELPRLQVLEAAAAAVLDPPGQRERPPLRSSRLRDPHVALR